MKRKHLLITALALMLLLTCCAAQTTYTAERDGKTFLLDTEAKTVTEGSHVYRYEHSGDSSRYSLTITYPDGSSYWTSSSGGVGTSGWSQDYDESAFVPGETLSQIILSVSPQKGVGGQILGGLLLILLGVLDAAFPKAAWYIGYGWRFKNAEPTEAALFLARLGGVVCAVLGVLLLSL